MQWNQKYSKAKMFTLVEEYLSGSITQNALCDREGLKKGTFKYWQRKYRLDSKSKKVKTSSNKEKTLAFIPISVPEVKPPTGCELELVYPNAVRLHIRTTLDTEGLSMLKQLVTCLD